MNALHFHISNLHFQPTNSFFLIGVVALVIVFTLSVTAWKRSVRPVRTGMLELLRCLCATIIVLMLWEPEWRTTIHPEDEPEIAILWDASTSGETIDAQLPASIDAEQAVVSRAAFIERSLRAPFWSELSAGGKVHVFQEPISAPREPNENEPAPLNTTDLSTPIENLLSDHDNLRAVILLSDGDHNHPGSYPASAAQKLLLQRVPLFTIPVGSPTKLPDLDLISVSAPTYGIVGENVHIPFSITSSLPRDVRRTITLRDTKTGESKSKEVLIPAGKSLHDSMIWKLKAEGASTLELKVPYSQDELIEENNLREFIISGRKESIKVLVIDTLPRWEYRFIRNALSRDPGVDLDCMLYHPQLGMGDGPDYIQEFPEDLEKLQQYDVVYIGDIGIGPDQLTKEQASLLKGLVENQASGIVFIPGPQGNQLSLLDSDLGDLIPVIYDTNKPKGSNEVNASPLSLTSTGRGSLLTLLADNEEENANVWRNLPGFYWFAPVIKEKAGTDVLAVHANRRNDYGSIPLLVTKQAGNGKVLFLGHDSAWRWRKGVEDLYHYRFWGNVSRWMSYQRNLASGERVRLYFSPERPQPDQVVTFNANAFDDNGAPLINGEVFVDVTDPTGKLQRIQLSSLDESWGNYTGRFRIGAPGEWKLTAGITGEADTTVETRLIVQGQQIEKIGQAARPAVLEEMARITKGQVVTPEQIADISSLINSLPERKPLQTRLPIWSHLITLAAIITLLSLFWIGRKLNGTF